MSVTDTIIVTDPVSGAKQKVIEQPHPVSVNGKRIYNADTLKVLPVFKSKAAEKLSVYLFYHLKTQLEGLDDGNYILSVKNAVIDNKGKLVYYEYDGIKKLIGKTVFTTPVPVNTFSPDSVNKFITEVNDTGVNIDPVVNAGTNAVTDGNVNKTYSRTEMDETEEGIDPKTKEMINSAAQTLLEELPLMKPAQLGHTNVSCIGPVFSSWNYFVVRDHKAMFTPFYDGL